MKTAGLTINEERNIKQLGSSGRNREVLRQNKCIMKVKRTGRGRDGEVDGHWDSL